MESGMAMKARDVMVTDVISVSLDTTVREVAEILVEKAISAVPVLSASGELVGIVSEGDLLRRVEIGTEKRRSSWLSLFTAAEAESREFVKAHARRVSDVMTRPVITATQDATLEEVATLLEKHGIKRVPIVRDGKVIGIVSRANLLRAFASASARALDIPTSDRILRRRLEESLRGQPWGTPWLITTTVQDGIVNLWGPVASPEQRQAIRVAAESTLGVKGVRDNLYRMPLAAE
jgi:CBS domain-containing protein